MKSVEAYNIDEYLIEMANLVPKQTGLSVNIWSDHGGVQRHMPHGKRVKIGTSDNKYSVSVTIEKEPEIKFISKALRKKKKGSSEWRAIEAGINYVGRNYDLFLRHFEDTTDEFLDKHLERELIKRGELKDV